MGNVSAGTITWEQGLCRLYYWMSVLTLNPACDGSVVSGLIWICVQVC